MQWVGRAGRSDNPDSLDGRFFFISRRAAKPVPIRAHPCPSVPTRAHPCPPVADHMSWAAHRVFGVVKSPLVHCYVPDSAAQGKEHCWEQAWETT